MEQPKERLITRLTGLNDPENYFNYLLRQTRKSASAKTGFHDFTGRKTRRAIIAAEEKEREIEKEIKNEDNKENKYKENLKQDPFFVKLKEDRYTRQANKLENLNTDTMFNEIKKLVDGIIDYANIWYPKREDLKVKKNYIFDKLKELAIVFLKIKDTKYHEDLNTSLEKYKTIYPDKYMLLKKAIDVIDEERFFDTQDYIDEKVEGGKRKYTRKKNKKKKKY